MKPFFFAPWGNYKVVEVNYDTTLGYSVVYGCQVYLGGAIKLDWMWVITRSALEIGTSNWNTVKTNVWAAINKYLPGLDPDTFLLQTTESTNSGCVYTPCLGDEIGLTGC